MTNEKKLELLKEFLKENNFAFIEDCVMHGWSMNLFMDKLKICVRLSDEDDQKFYKKIRHRYHPLFIRESETADFVIEKMQNLIFDLMTKEQKRFQKEQRQKEAKKEAQKK